MNVLGVAAVGLISTADRIARSVLSMAQRISSNGITLGTSRDYRSTAATDSGMGINSVVGGMPHVLAAGRTDMATYSQPTLQANLAAFSRYMGKVFTDNQIDTTREIVLTADAEGRLRLANDHPDKGRIEQLLQDPTVSAAFQSLAGQAARVQASFPSTVSSPSRFYLALTENTVRVFFA